MANARTSSKRKVSIKHIQIDKSQSTMMIVIAAAVALSIFGLFATKALVTKGLYQRRVLDERREVAVQLQENYDSAQKLFTQYSVFAEDNPNVLGGSLDGEGNIDGSNPRIVLNALPSTYDAPALATSLEKILTGRNMLIGSIAVTDDPGSYADDPQASPKPQAVTLSFQGTSNFRSANQLLSDFERSIRPFDITKLEISGSDDKLQLSVDLTTYFQPAKSLKLEATKEVK